MSEARDQILARVRGAIAQTPRPAAAPRAYRRADPRGQAELIEQFCERVGDYRAEVQRVRADRVADAIRTAAQRHRAQRLAVAPGLPQRWTAGCGLQLVPDDGLAVRELDTLDGVISGASVAIAETGTIVLSGAPHEGRRLLSLVPDLHICVVEHQQVVGLLPQALERLHGAVSDERRPLTFISGPSATSDIELQRVEGVHGPRRLVVIVTQEPS